MKLNRDVQEYLNGSKFSKGVKFVFAEKESSVPDRITLIRKITKDKSVIHVGCADHIELIEKKRKKNTWLHQILIDNTSRCAGIDLNPESISYMKNTLNIPDVHCIDITRDKVPEILNLKWDYLLLGEVLEHIGDPVSFLRSVRDIYRGVAEKILITVPNGFCYENLINTFRQRELINSDHKYWFTPYTISKVMAEAYLEVDEILLCELSRFRCKTLNIKKQINKFILKKYPGFRSTIVVTAKI